MDAFALPGGPVFIATGLITLMHTEDELAAVLGHEVEHIDHARIRGVVRDDRLDADRPVRLLEQTAAGGVHGDRTSHHR